MPWWKRAEVWLWLLWSASSIVRFSRGRLWGASAEPGSWLHLVMAVVTFTIALTVGVTGWSAIESKESAVSDQLRPALLSRHLALRTGLALLAAGGFTLPIVVDERSRMVGALVLSLVLALLVGVGGLFESWARARGALQRVVAAGAVATITTAGVLVAVLQADYAGQVLTGNAPEAAASQVLDDMRSTLARLGALAVGAGVGHAGVVVGRSLGSFRFVAALLVLLLMLFLVALLGAPSDQPFTRTGEGLFAGALFLGFSAFSAWGADTIEHWWWGPSDEEVCE